MVRYNVNEIIRVEWFDAVPDKNYIYSDGEIFLSCSGEKSTVRVPIPSNHIIKDGVVYKNPMVHVLRRQEMHDFYYFSTIEQAYDFVEEIFPVQNARQLVGQV
jgi:hypothetical protein